MIAAPPADHVLRLAVDAIDVVSRLASAADERQIIATRIAHGVLGVRTLDDGLVELRVRIDVDTLQALEDATEIALPEAV